MIGIIPAAGKGTRLNNSIKSLIFYKRKRLIEHPLECMRRIGINRVIIIHHGTAIPSVLGTSWNGVKLEYVEQEERKGIAHAINLAKKKVGEEDVCVILGDIYFDGKLNEMVVHHANLGGCVVGVQEVSDKALIKESYGINKANGKFIEKPKDVESLEPLLGLGIYMFDNTLFNCIDKTVSDENDQLQITDVLNQFENVGFSRLEGTYKNINREEDK